METVYTPAEVAARLGVNDSQARRVARTYEKVYGPLGKDSRRARLFTSSALERIEAAHAAIAAGQYASLEAALVGQRDGVLPAPVPSRGDLLAVTLSNHGEWLQDHGERLAQLEGYLLKERDDLKRRNDYLLAELRRRDEVQQQPRRWWFRG